MKLQFDSPGFDAPWIITGLLLIPYLCWGVYLLRFRLKYHLDFNRATETFTVAGLMFFFLLQFSTLHEWLAKSPALYLFASVGLIASGVALYGPIVSSFISHSLVELVMPGSHHHTNEPRYGAGEAFEQNGDFARAAKEYIAVSAMFPKDVKSALRAGDNLMKVDEADEAAAYFERALENMHSPDQSLRLANRLVDIYQRELEEPDQAERVLEEFVEKYPDSEFTATVQQRLDRMRTVEPLPAGKDGPGPGPYSFTDLRQDLPE